MPKQRQEIVRHIFKGGRFEDHGLDIDILPELIAYKALLVKVAKELWRRNNPDKERLPANFEESFSLKFYALEPNCTCVPLYRVIDSAGQGSLFDEPDEFLQAVPLVANAIRAADVDAALPSDLPANALHLFENYGKTLRNDECIEQVVHGDPSPARYTLHTRSRLLELADRSYQDSVEIVGTVTMAKVSLPRMTVTLRDGRDIEAVFRPEEEDVVTTALKEHATVQVKVRGRGIFAPNGTLRRIAETTRVELLRAETSTVISSAVPIWEVFQEIMQGVPKEQLDLLPHDAASQHDHYLYGAPKHE
ncbi:MAG: hypothetical protein KKE86_10085 [Planctomycetes bacterium]|nr:hypothetical protein [Planctomycetota bacterium]MBU4399668.1 hypothetical protein [Planctomycetota bacterium]MCG2685722.1 hypothetical protein [Planctomycetales bacterium]